MKVAAVVLLFSCLMCKALASVEIVPNSADLWLLKGSKLELQCVYKYTGAQEKIDFYKDGKAIPEDNTDGFMVKTNKKVEGSHDVCYITLTKTEIGDGDGGKYECKLDPEADKDAIDVHIFQVKQVNATLNETLKAPAFLQCQVEGIDLSMRNTMTISWEHNNETLSNGTDSKYSMFNNGTLIISNPERADMGFYYCKIELKSGGETHTVNQPPVSLNAGPMVVKSDNPKNMVQGDELELKCEVTGHPFPTVTWYKDSSKINATTRIHFLEYKGSMTGKVKIYSLDFPDEGKYECKAFTAGFPEVSATMNVTVKDKLAALWPFLGIVAEVVILCVIILLYEKKRSKNMASEDDTQDNNMDNTVDHKDVRHRRS